MAPEEMNLRSTFKRPNEDKLNALHLPAVLASLRPDERTYLAAIDAAELQRIGRALASYAVALCDREVSGRETTRAANLERRAATIAGWYGLTVTASGDPRGYVLRLHGDKLPSNSWGDGFGVA